MSILQEVEQLLYNGEFAAWLNTQKLPNDAAKELVEFEMMVDKMRESFDEFGA